MAKDNIVLVGFMGTGKTTVGRILAERTGRTLVDMDSVIEERAGKAISEIFADEGEPHFRALERALCQELSAGQDQIIACGGGVVLNADNISDYAASGLVVCLSASTDMILERVSKESHRPLLEDGDKAQKILGILASRKELYGAVRHQIDTTTLTPEQVADVILKMP